MEMNIQAHNNNRIRICCMGKAKRKKSCKKNNESYRYMQNFFDSHDMIIFKSSSLDQFCYFRGKNHFAALIKILIMRFKIVMNSTGQMRFTCSLMCLSECDRNIILCRRFVFRALILTSSNHWIPWADPRFSFELNEYWIINIV